ncbi:MAG TPA: GNAT family N-acetyltransferase [Usitatibacter sp.]|nr:GNAT family N-acetyltransferase [Usitatibacter sp.]
MTPDARRIEELSLNSSAPPGQLLYDGWIVRLLRGKAKRARSVNAVYPSSRPLAEKIAYCERLYQSCALPVLFRITPFSQPAQLDPELGRRGYVRYESTAVEATPIDLAKLNLTQVEPMDLAAWVEAVGELRGSPVAHRSSHFARLDGMPLAKRAVAIRSQGRVLATGLTIVEDDCAGLFDIITHDEARRQGHARTVVSSLLRMAWELGARYAYLQVEEKNEPARRLYAQFGFVEQYLYWYRGREGVAA